jgi:SAM-dependent methyltransferase
VYTQLTSKKMADAMIIRLTFLLLLLLVLPMATVSEQRRCEIINVHVTIELAIGSCEVEVPIPREWINVEKIFSRTASPSLATSEADPHGTDNRAAKMRELILSSLASNVPRYKETCVDGASAQKRFNQSQAPQQQLPGEKPEECLQWVKAIEEKAREDALRTHEACGRPFWGKKNSESNDVLQSSNYTSFNRYPAVFTAARQWFANNISWDKSSLESRKLRLLSFGSSYGDEIRTLKQLYFPEASVIHGVEIEPSVLAAARASLTAEFAAPSDIDGNDGSGRVARARHSASMLTPPGWELYKHPEECLPRSYDAVFALSVLCSQASAADLGDSASAVRIEKQILDLEKFLRALQQIWRLLRPGGILVLYNSNYDVAQTNLGPLFECVDAGSSAGGDARDGAHAHGVARVQPGNINKVSELQGLNRHLDLLPAGWVTTKDLKTGLLRSGGNSCLLWRKKQLFDTRVDLRAGDM